MLEALIARHVIALFCELDIHSSNVMFATFLSQAGHSGFLFDADEDDLVTPAEVETMVEEIGIVNTPLHDFIATTTASELGLSWTNLLGRSVSNAVSSAQVVGEALVNAIADATLPSSDLLDTFAGGIVAAQSMIARTTNQRAQDGGAESRFTSSDISGSQLSFDNVLSAVRSTASSAAFSATNHTLGLFRSGERVLCQSAWNSLPSQVDSSLKALADYSKAFGYNSASMSTARYSGSADFSEAGVAYDASDGSTVCFRGGGEGGGQIGAGGFLSARPIGSFTVSIHDDIANVNSNQFVGFGSLSASFYASASVSIAASWRADSSTICNAIGGGLNSILGATAGVFSCDLERVSHSLSDLAAAAKPHSWSVTGTVGARSVGVRASVGYKFWKPSGCVDLSQTNSVCEAPNYNCGNEFVDLTITPEGCWDVVTSVASNVVEIIQDTGTRLYEAVRNLPETLQTVGANIASSVGQGAVTLVNTAAQVASQLGTAFNDGVAWVADRIFGR
eukprot:3395097-Pleurochrysis_carterae.AAC.1